MHDRYFGLSSKIARWKEPSDFENLLANSAELNPESKHLYSEYYKHLNPEYYTKGYEGAKKMYQDRIQDFRDTDFDTLFVDMVYCLHRYGLSFQDYFIYNLINKSERERKTFVSDKLRYHYCDILNKEGISRIMTDKYACYKNYSNFFKREVVGCRKKEDLEEFLSFTRKNKKFIYKPLYDHSGHGIEIVNASSINPEAWFMEMIQKKPGVAEQLIVQGEDMGRLNPSSINSCRIVTFTIGSDVTFIGGALRMGVGSAFTDNAGSGGIYASIDVQNGIIQSDAKNYHNQHFKFHPTTNIQIVGFRLPEWENAKELVRRMATTIKGTTLISWDIAFSTGGWCMVEANENGDWSIIQSNLEVGKKSELYTLMDLYFQSQSTLS